MTISEVIKFFEEQKKIHGDVALYSDKSDGRDFWLSPYNPSISHNKYSKIYKVTEGY